MAAKKTNSLQANSDTLADFFRIQAISQAPQTSNISIGGGAVPSMTGGKQTISQDRSKYLADIDWRKRSLLQNLLEFGTGTDEEGRKLQKEVIKQIKSEAISKQSPKGYEEKISQIKQEEERPKPKKLYRVMFAGEGPESSYIAETKEEADKILAESGKKGAIAGINLSQKTRGGKMLSDEDVQKRSEDYIAKMPVAQNTEERRAELLKKFQSPGYKKELIAQRETANKAKRAMDKEAGAGFADWKADVKAQRESEGILNTYNQQLGSLKQAYTQAKQAGDPLAAYQIQEYIQEYQAGVPKEMGARKKFAESGALQEKTDILQKKMQEAREQAERERRLARVNPDYNR